jgi:hypothetical protein
MFPKAAPAAKAAAPNDRLDQTANEFVAALKPSELEGLEAYWKTGRGLPTDIDRRLLPQGRDAIGGDLDGAQKTYLRTAVQRLVKAKTK